MPHRKLVNIGDKVTLPTISQFLREMASRQHEEINRLKREASEGLLPDPTVPEEHHEQPTPDPWQLHPVRVKRAAGKRTAAKRTPKRKTAKSAAKKKAKPLRRAKTPVKANKSAAKKR
jgi:hypothetical protein